jgi:hypothetical protein
MRVFFLLLLALAPTPALACRGPGPDAIAQREAEFRRSVSDARAIVHAVVERDIVAGGGGGRLRVVRVYRGDLRPGAILAMSHAVPRGCLIRPEDSVVPRGRAGLAIIPRGAMSPIPFTGFLPQATLDWMTRERLIDSTQSR